MAYKIKLGSFKKHENSTAQPTTTGWAEYDVVLKDGAELNNPVVTLSIDYTTVVNYNYAVLFDRYYFITSKTMLRTGLCAISLSIDVLATYKTDIGSASMYILRSSASSDGDIIDNFYASKGDIEYATQTQASFTPETYSSGCYIVNIMGTATSGTSTLWKLTPANFRALIDALYVTIDGFQVTDIKDAVSKFLGGSPEKLVSSAMWLPNYGFGVGTLQEIVVGGWASGVNGQLITNPVYEEISWINLTVPKHPQAATRGAFLNLSPYSTYTLSIPLFGTINVDTTAIKNSTSINCAFSVDALTGQGKCRITAQGTNAPIIADLTAQVGASVPLQGQNNGASVVGGITSTLAGVAAAVASGGAAVPVIGAIAGGIGTAVTSLTGASCSMGSTGGILAARLVPTLNCTFIKLVNEDNTNNGRPYCQVSTPSTLTGYMQAYKSTVEIDGTLTEQEMIANYVENGFYYE